MFIYHGFHSLSMEKSKYDKITSYKRKNKECSKKLEIAYSPRCIYCGTVNKIRLSTPINYQMCEFYCRNCRNDNVKKIRGK